MTNILILMVAFMVIYAYQILKRRIEDIEFKNEIKSMISEGTAENLIKSFSVLDKKIDSLIINKKDKEHIL